MVEDGGFRHKRDYVIVVLQILKLKGHQNWITGLRGMAILLNDWSLPIGGASAVEGLLSTEPTQSSLVSQATQTYQLGIFFFVLALNTLLFWKEYFRQGHHKLCTKRFPIIPIL